MTFRRWQQWLLQRPYLLAGVCAFAAYLALTASIDFTFMADDWSHLATAHAVENPFSDRFSQWLSRVPVWAVATWALFSSHIMEVTWAPMYLFFAAHIVGVLLASKWLARELFREFEIEQPRAATIVAVGTAVTLHPNTYGILYWPTCMPYALGALFMAAALWSKTAWRFAFFLLAFLTYETFFLPSVAILLAPSALAAIGRRDWRALAKRENLIGAGTWFAAAITTLAIRAIAASQVGGFQYQTTMTLRHVGRQLNLAFNQLFKIHFAFSGTNEFATVLQLAVLLAAIVLLWRTLRWRPLALVLLLFASTGVYWVLNYSAMRAIYGSQVFLAAVLLSLVTLADRAQPRYHAPVLVLVGLMAAGYVYQTMTILSVKDFNASVLRSQESRLAAQIGACEDDCIVEHGALDSGLRRDGVLHRDYWGYYLDFMRAKYAHGKKVRFTLTEHQGAAP